MSILILALAGTFLLWNVGLAGSNGLEKWIGLQLQSIANSYIKPELSFDDIDYEYPGTVRLKNFRIAAGDPAHSGQTVDIIKAAGATITLAEIPHVGRPIKISQFVLDQPEVQFISVEPGKAKLVGFGDFVKPGAVKKEPTSKPDKKLSDIFQIRMIRLNDGKVVYDPRVAGQEPLVLDHIWTETDIVPSADGASYDLSLGLNRQPVFSLDARGRFNLDTLELTNTAITLDGSVGHDKEAFLPPQLQKVVDQYQIEGKLSIHFTGSVPFKDYKAADVNFDTRLTRANLTTEEFRLPIQRFDIDAQMKDRKLVVSSITLKALKGRAEANGIVRLNRRLDSDLHLDVADMRIDDLFVHPGTAEKPKMAGKLAANINAAMPISALIVRLSPDSATSAKLQTLAPELLEPMPAKWGAGQIHLDKGRLVDVPVLEQLSRAIKTTTSLLTFKRKSEPTEKLDMKFDFMGDQIKIGEFTYAGEIVAARGNGAIALDQRLDLTVNGGPISKLTSLLGTTIGEIVTTVTPELVTYKVTGTIDEPKVAVVLGPGKTQEVVTGVGEKTVGEVGKVGKSIGNGAKGLLDTMLGK